MPGTEFCHIPRDSPVPQDAVSHQFRQFGEVLLAKAKANHLADPHAQSAGGGEALLLGSGLIIDDNMVLLQSLSDFGTAAVAHGHDNLVGLRVINAGVAGHIQSLGLQALGKVLGAFDNVPLILVLKGVHLIGSHQQAQLGAQVVVGYAAGEGPGLDGLPQAVFQFLLLVVDAHHAALRAKKGLVGRTGDDLSALFEGFLEMAAY